MRLAREHSFAGGAVLADRPKQDVRNLLKFGFSDSFRDGSLYSALYCSIGSVAFADNRTNSTREALTTPKRTTELFTRHIEHV